MGAVPKTPGRRGLLAGLLPDNVALPDLTIPEADELCALAQRGDVEARHKLVLHFTRKARLIVESAVRFYRLGPRGMIEPDDIFQVAMVGMLSAIDTYEPELGGTFSQYAGQRIRWEIWREMTLFAGRDGKDIFLKAIEGWSGAAGELEDPLTEYCAAAVRQGKLRPEVAVTFLMRSHGATAKVIHEEQGITRKTVWRRCAKAKRVIARMHHESEAIR